MVDRTDFLMNPCGDEAVDNGDSVLVGGVDQIRQSWTIHMRTLRGEIDSNLNLGMPWVGKNGILAKHSSTARVEQYFIEESLKVPGILRVNGVEVTVVDAASRTWKIAVDCFTEGEEQNLFSYQGNVPAENCSSTGSLEFPLLISGLIIWFDAQDLGNLVYVPDTSLRMENKAGTGYAEGMVDGPELLDDGDMEEPGTDNWVPLSSAVLTKELSTISGGTRCLRVAYGGVSNPSAYKSNILVIGQTYTVSGWARGDGVAAYPRIVHNAEIWAGDVTNTWQHFSETFVAGSVSIVFRAMAASPGYSEFDDLSIRAVGSGFPTLSGVSELNNRRSVYLNNTVANGNTEHLSFFDTKALRPEKDYTVFTVVRLLEGPAPLVGLFGFRGQNDSGIVEECISVCLALDELGNPELISISKSAGGTQSASIISIPGLSFYEPMRIGVVFKSGQITGFIVNGVSYAGDDVLPGKKLDGDGYIGASMDTLDCKSPDHFSFSYWGDFLAWERELSTDEIQQIDAWLAQKWGF